MRLRSFDLIGAGLIALLTVSVAFWSPAQVSILGRFPAWFLPFGILMVLFIPGYVLTLAILPHLDRATVLLLSLGISLSMDVIGGLLLHYTSWGLQPASWAIWLSSITLLGCPIAAHRRASLSKQPTASRSAMPAGNWMMIVGVALSAIIIFTAITIARDSAISSGTTFTQLWAVPAIDKDGYAIQIGIRNEELNTIRYNLVAESRGTTINNWDNISLAPGENWKTSLSLPDKPSSPITILLYITEKPDEAYRMVRLVPISFDLLTPAPDAGR